MMARKRKKKKKKKRGDNERKGILPHTLSIDYFKILLIEFP